MNLNNLEDRIFDMQALGFSEENIKKMQELMEKNAVSFNLYETHRADKGGVIDYTVYIKKSAQSDFYYLPKFDAVQDKVKTGPEQKYLVITPHEEPGKSLVRKLETINEALDYFALQPKAELAIGKDAKSKLSLAQREGGKVIYAERNFRSVIGQPPIPQTFYVEEGKGMTKIQAGNLVQGRAVFRDDLVNFQGQPYTAWIALNFNKPRDRYGNYPLQIYSVPNYGFDLKTSLSEYKIGEMEQPKLAAQIENAICNGERIIVTCTNADNEKKQVFMEASVRFRTLNFFRMDGKPEMREQFLKLGASQRVSGQMLSNNQSQQQENGARVRR
ncbi:MAG: hypothetical protein LBF27_30990 [Sphingobacterium sp.]|jgi:hypothetical protein|nr:hypothetical protein [Sphingobacterium sp.]